MLAAARKTKPGKLMRTTLEAKETNGHLLTSSDMNGWHRCSSSTGVALTIRLSPNSSKPRCQTVQRLFESRQKEPPGPLHPSSVRVAKTRPKQVSFVLGTRSCNVKCPTMLKQPAHVPSSFGSMLGCILLWFSQRNSSCDASWRPVMLHFTEFAFQKLQARKQYGISNNGFVQ